MRVSRKVDGVSLLSFLKDKFGGLSVSYLKYRISRGDVLVCGRSAETSHQLKEGDTVEILFRRDKPVISACSRPVQVIFEDEFIIAVDKPPKVASHPACGNYSETLVNMLMGYFGIESIVLGGKESMGFGLVNRLDRDTSGILLVARAPGVHRVFQEQFAEMSVEKEYLAITEGVPGWVKKTVSLPLKPDGEKRAVMRAHPAGKEALTRLELLEAFDGRSIIRAIPVTGRRHQVRAHMASAGLPIAGDILYGGRLNPGCGIERVMLHCRSLGFRHPRSGRKMRLSAEPAEDMKRVLEGLS